MACLDCNLGITFVLMHTSAMCMPAVVGNWTLSVQSKDALSFHSASPATPRELVFLTTLQPGSGRLQCFEMKHLLLQPLPVTDRLSPTKGPLPIPLEALFSTCANLLLALSPERQMRASSGLLAHAPRWYLQISWCHVLTWLTGLLCQQVSPILPTRQINASSTPQ